MERWCAKCKITKLHHNKRGELCYACEEKYAEKIYVGEPPYYDAKDLAFILGLEHDESVKRKARKGELPPSIPSVRKKLWLKKTIDAWLESGQCSSSNWILAGNDLPMSTSIQRGMAPVTPSSAWVKFPQPFAHTPVVVATGVDVVNIRIPKIEPGSFLWTSPESGNASWVAI